MRVLLNFGPGSLPVIPEAGGIQFDIPADFDKRIRIEGNGAVLLDMKLGAYLLTRIVYGAHLPTPELEMALHDWSDRTCPDEEEVDL